MNMPQGAPGPAVPDPYGQQPTQPHAGQPAYGGGGPDLGERAAHAASAAARHVKTPETKEFFKSSEFLVWLATAVAILIAGAATSGGPGDDVFLADDVWTLVAATSIGYMISRGLSKAGTRRGYGDAPMDRGY